MHEMYLEVHERSVFDEISAGGTSKPMVTYETYRTRFNTHHNISFGRLRSDTTCTVCDELEMKTKSAGPDERQSLQLQRELQADRFYKSLQADTQDSKSSASVCILAFDFEQNLPLLHLPVGEIFYLRQLWLYAFGVHCCSDDSASIFYWDETVAKKGANEVISCLDYYFTRTLPDEVDTLNLYSDGCGGQNKNRFVIMYLYSLVKLGRFKKIKHVFLIRGHSFLPCDRDFGVIEQKKRKKERVYVPKEWMTLIETARKRKPFDVVGADQSIFHDYQEHLSPNVTLTHFVSEIFIFLNILTITSMKFG